MGPSSCNRNKISARLARLKFQPGLKFAMSSGPFRRNENHFVNFTEATFAHLCLGLNAVTNFTIFRKFRSFRSFRSFRNFRNFRNFGQGFPATLDNQASLNKQWP